MEKPAGFDMREYSICQRKRKLCDAFIIFPLAKVKFENCIKVWMVPLTKGELCNVTSSL